ncbi:UNVERIFIED_CONTAM: hypothetical protein Scaly_1761200 [Sesamum calycinum]|uniref:DUF241 domain protein n=1 Tax=Sesamum calycinum TaxID=2727403 RepID=A0AAW2NV68_9LAMI
MAYLHCRSNSLPSKSHPEIEDVENHLHRLKSSETTSTSAASVLKKLASLGDLQESINSLIQLPSVHQIISHKQGENWTDEILGRSLELVDLCGFSRDVVTSTKEAVQELESSIRRNRCETALKADISSYDSSRKKINRRANKYIKNLKSFKQTPSALNLDTDCDLKAIATMLKETEALGFSVLKSVFILVWGAKGRSNQRSRSLLSKFTQASRVHSEDDQESGNEDSLSLKIEKSFKSKDDMINVQNILKQLKASEMIIQELEEGLEAFFRSLVRTRVSLLNILSH